jgi:hypothetical protein
MKPTVKSIVVAEKSGLSIAEAEKYQGSDFSWSGK